MDTRNTYSTEMYIDGSWTQARSGLRFEVRNPATLEPLAEVADGGREETRAAIEAASAAFPDWAERAPEDRSHVLLRVAERIAARRDDLAVTLTKENGKPLASARAEVDSAVETCAWYAEEARRVVGRTYPPEGSRRRFLTLRQPVGVVAAVIPFNFPVQLLLRKLAPALAAGCTAVVRPARATPLTAVKLFEILAEAGLPAGVANLVTGSDSSAMGEELATHPQVRKLTFTGSTAVGKQLLRLAAGTIKRVSLELGGHSPFIVFEDADLDKAATEAVLAGYRNSGQVCISVNRVLVHQAVAAPFTERLAAKARTLRVGDGLVDGTDLGPLNSKSGYEKVVEHVNDARSKGARVVAGGAAPRLESHLRGYFYEPTVLAGATPEMAVMREETFGPVMPIATFATEQEALHLANDTPYGLAGYFFTENASRLFRVAERLECGIIGANTSRPAAIHFPFGGMKESGLGRENGVEGIEAFLELKSVAIGL